MSQIDIKVNRVRYVDHDLRDIASRLRHAENSLSSIRYHIDPNILHRRNISPRLDEALKQIRELEEHVNELHRFLDHSMELYIKADRKVNSLELKEPEKKSIWDRIKEGFDVVSDSVTGFIDGIVDAVVSTVEGLWNIVTHPVETINGIVYFVQHPVETSKNIWNAIAESWENDVINGDAESRGNWFGRAFGEVALAVVGTKGIDKAVKLTKGAKFVEEAGGVRVTKGLTFNNPGEYFNHINDIGKRTDLTSEQKFAKIQEAYAAFDVKGDVTVVSDMKFLKPEGFVDGRMNIDWPDKMGFADDSIQTIHRSNPLPEKWDRVGGKGGENFTTLPDNGIPYTYDQRAIPYLENPSARHVGTFDNESYFDAIDSIRNGNLEELNKVIVANGKNPISNVDFIDFRAHYDDFQNNINNVIGNTDATYGVKGTAAPWINSSTGEKLMNGGAEQIVTPLNAEMLEMIGIIPKY
ncbi:hypothetical protein KO561_16655 [Radiobacillus kanasensis]|uniref:hypothetical protein n=1 Tax=Radiobacillus kanasensis TaxID=2844358 RepID=UPI001E3ACFDB|nr:hypothetical protein [Radiobacillus kanasensis]UFT98806.1 hypothetical protein KO561_16655 [Radiobacillus kanasensis]